MTNSHPSDRPTPARSVSDFDRIYESTPPWEIGRPQPPFAELADAGAFSGRVLDSGCGTGEHALLAASLGLEATGVDLSPRAIARARDKATARGLSVRFEVRDALALSELGERFDTVIDSGLFHVFDDERRARYVGELSEVIVSGGTYFMACFSEREPGDWGPRRVHADEIRAAFSDGWRVRSIDPVHFLINFDPGHAEAWLAAVERR